MLQSGSRCQVAVPKQAHAGNELRRDKAPACKARFSNQDGAWRSEANSHPIMERGPLHVPRHLGQTQMPSPS